MCGCTEDDTLALPRLPRWASTPALDVIEVEWAAVRAPFPANSDTNVERLSDCLSLQGGTLYG